MVGEKLKKENLIVLYKMKKVLFEQQINRKYKFAKEKYHLDKVSYKFRVRVEQN
jgi:hypothetical protein